MKDSKVYNWCVRNNIGFKLLALFLAFMLWYYVAGQRDPIIKRDFTLPVEARGLSSESVLVSPLPDVQVSTRGMRSIMRDVKGDDIRVYVQISDQEVGEKLLPVQVESPFGVQVVSISHERLKVDLDVMSEKQVPVQVLVHGEAAPGFTYRTASASPEQVTVKAPSRFLDEILDVQAVIEIKGAKNDISQQVKVQLAKNYGDQVTVQPGTVQVKLPVVTSGPVKTVAVTIALQGEVAEGFVVKSQSVEPKTLQVTGPTEVMANLREIRTQPVDISGAQGNITKDVELVLPAGVISLGQNKAKVTIVIETVEEEQLPGE
ncbi:MAG: CdaR family protein [Syntrophaceticus schinkii]|jgi:YbbR domain-containing protein